MTQPVLTVRKLYIPIYNVFNKTWATCKCISPYTLQLDQIENLTLNSQKVAPNESFRIY